MRSSLLFLVVLVPAMASSQDRPLVKHKPKPITDNGYVTEAEAKAVFLRAEKLVRSVTGSKISPPALPLAGSGAISREKTLLNLARLYEVARPKVKLTPRAVQPDTGVLKMTPASMPVLVKFVRMGAVANYGRLAAGPEDRLTVREFGDALGFFLARLAQMTHTPSSRWSPPLMDARF